MPEAPQTDSNARPSPNENHLLINAYTTHPESPLLSVTRRIADSGCNLVDARLATVGRDVSVTVLAVGSWDAVAKLDALAIMESQFYEGGANGSAELMPSDPEKQKARHKEVREGFARRNQSIAGRFRKQLSDWYPAGEAEKVKHAEGFELCEYGAQPNKAELKRLFPFFE
jgi:hypothetical protein